MHPASMNALRKNKTTAAAVTAAAATGPDLQQHKNTLSPLTHNQALRSNNSSQ